VTDDLAAVLAAAGVVVATPTSTHADVLAALRVHTDAPVFCEKPLCTSAAECGRIAALPGRIFPMHVWRYHPGVELIADLLREGSLGEPTWVRSTRTNGPSPRHDVDPVWTLAPHDVSIAVEVLGEIPEPRWAVAELVDDRCRSLVGALGASPPFVLEVSDREAVRTRELRAHGSEGSALLDGDGPPVVRLLGMDGRVREQGFDPTPPLDRELAAFLGHLDGGPPPKSDLDEGLAVVRTVARLRELAGVRDGEALAR
jgi:predicted dehydrogenase